jgi:Uma2 family endonuclease
VTMGAVKTLLTFEEFEQLPDQPGKQELVRGELIELPPADYKHNDIADRVCDGLKAALKEAHARGESGELGRVFLEMGYLLPGACWLQPDVSVTHAKQRIEKYLIGAPAIAIEVIAPSNTPKRVAVKMELYFECGALQVWCFFPKTRHVSIQVPGSKRVVAVDGVITTPLLPGLALSVQEVFGD